MNTTATSSSLAASNFTLADLERTVAVLEAMPPEPIGEWMRARGCPPEQWTLLLPDALRADVGQGLTPSYVRFADVPKAMCVLTSVLSLGVAL